MAARTVTSQRIIGTTAFARIIRKTIDAITLFAPLFMGGVTTASAASYVPRRRMVLTLTSRHCAASAVGTYRSIEDDTRSPETALQTRGSVTN
jgi:hypothetical protein